MDNWNKSSLHPNISQNQTELPHQEGDFWKITARCIYIIVFILGTAGNLLTCYVIITRKFMRRVIHIYTFNLALSDLIVILLYIPVEIVRNENDLRWVIGKTMCKVNSFVTPTSLMASIFTLVAITLDRHRGVTKPFLWRGDSNKLLKWTIPGIWLVSIMCSYPLFHYSAVQTHSGSKYCVEQWPSQLNTRIYWITMFLLTVVIPLFIIIFANAHMIYVMKRVHNAVSQTDQAEQHKQHRRMIRMVIALVLVYAICSSPQHITFFWFVYGDLEKREALSKHIFKASNLMIIFQSAINPIIYGIGRKDFRTAFKNTFQCIRLRIWVSETNSSPQNGALRSLVFSVAQFDQLSCDGEKADQSLSNPSLFSQDQPLINKKLENLRKKIEVRARTDTPPIQRKTSLSVHKPNGVFTREKNLSLPVSSSFAKKEPLRNKHSPLVPSFGEPRSIKNGTPRFSQFVIDAKELFRLPESPETIL